MPNGSPIGWPPMSPGRSWRSAADTASSCTRSADRLDVPLAGIDFSPTQLRQARHYLGGEDDVGLFLGSGECLPFPDRSFDMVVTSAVILHNPPPAAERIRREILRVARRFAAHNEETSSSYNRYGYDISAWYRERGIALARIATDPHGPRSPVLAVLRRRARAVASRSHWDRASSESFHYRASDA